MQFSIRWLICVVVVVFVCASVCDAKPKKKKCSRLVGKIPVHKKFQLDRFVGTWFVAARTKFVYGDDTYESASIEFSGNADGTYNFLLTGQLGDACVPVESGTVMETGRPGQYTLRFANGDDVAMVISFTNYETALVYWCLRFRPGRKDQCRVGGMQGEIMSRSKSPVKRDINSYTKRMGKRLCVKPAELYSTTPGVCEIPEILAEVKKKKLEVEVSSEGSKEQGPKCAVNNIPVQDTFSLSEMSGLWWEIARTRFTFNKMESVIAYHKYDDVDSQIFSYYTGTVEGTCMTAIQGTSRSVEGALVEGDMEGRIGGPDSQYPWAPMKMLYADDKYLLFYACYTGASDSACPQPAMEVTLVGRSRDIEPDTMESIYSILPDICVDPDDMIETIFTANCSSWVAVEIDTDVDPSDCPLDEIPTYPDFVKSMLLGEWYMYASISHEGEGHTKITMVNNTMGPSDSIITKHLGPSSEDGACERISSSYSRERCLDVGDFVTTVPHHNIKDWVFGKVLYLDDNLWIHYVCTYRNVEGSCDNDAAHVYVYTRNGTAGNNTEEIVHESVKTACLDPNDLQYATDWCETFTADEDDTDASTHEYDVDHISIFDDLDDFYQTGIHGYWYEIVGSAGLHHGQGSGGLVSYLSSYDNTSLNIHFTGKSGHGNDRECMPVQHIHVIPRCIAHVNGDYLVPHNSSMGVVAYVPMKIIYTDYTNVLLTYTCQDVQANGSCGAGGAQIRVWGRNTTIDDETREYVYDIAFWTNVDPYQEGYLIEADHDESCFEDLEEYVLEKVVETEEETDSDENDDSDYDNDDEEKEQKDQVHEELIFDDLDAILEMPDDEFYYS